MANLITFGGLSIPNGEISESYENIENIQKSEAGTDIGTTTRLMKLSLGVELKCDGNFYKRLKRQALLTQGVLVYQGVEYDARLRITGAKFEKYSEMIEGAKGLWTVSISIIEV